MFQDTDFKEIELTDKGIFDHYISKNYYENSEFTFTNFFIWRYHYQLSYTVSQDQLCLIGRYRQRFPIIFPPLGDLHGEFDSALMEQVEYFQRKGYPVIIKGITESIKEVMEQAMPGVFRYKSDRNNYDYIYSSEDLIHLKGRKYQKKRNHINRFKNLYEFSYEPIAGDNIEEFIIAEMEWAAARPNNRGIQEEKAAIIEALRNFDVLGIQGGAIRIQGKIEAFSLGELLNPDMAVIHIEKANVEYEGSYAMINQQFTEHCWNNIPYINREEDMGLPGLRKAKESYYPIKMIKKYTGLLV